MCYTNKEKLTRLVIDIYRTAWVIVWDNMGDSCFSINQTGGFCVCRSSFFVHLTNFRFRDNGKTSRHFENFIWRWLSWDMPCLMNQSESAKSATNPPVWLILIDKFIHLTHKLMGQGKKVVLKYWSNKYLISIKTKKNLC